MSSVKFWWIGFGLLTIVTLFQATVGHWFRLGASLPDLMLMILVFFVIDLRLSSAMALAILATFLKNCTTGEPFLLTLLSLTMVTLFSHWSAKQLVKEIFWVQLGILAMSCWMVHFLAFLWFHHFYSLGSAMTQFFSHVLLTVLYTVALTPWVWRCVHRLLLRCGWRSSTGST